MCDWGIAVKEKTPVRRRRVLWYYKKGRGWGVGMVMDGKGGGLKNLG